MQNKILTFVVIAALAGAAYVAANYFLQEGLIYIGIGLIVALVLLKLYPNALQWIWSKKAVAGGLIFGVSFILLSFITSFSVAIPETASIVGVNKYLIISVLAPVLEELFFIGVFYLVLARQLLRWPAFVGIVVASLAFAVYHIAAYGGDFTLNSGAFIGAFVFRLLSFAVFSWSGGSSSGVIATIIGHSIINTYILATREGFF